jgi:hypothetical protein
LIGIAPSFLLAAYCDCVGVLIPEGLEQNRDLKIRRPWHDACFLMAIHLCAERELAMLPTANTIFAVMFGGTACASATLASESATWFTVGAISYHLDREKRYNEANGGVGFEYQFNDHHLVAAERYRNSRFNMSNLLYYAWTPVSKSNLNFAFLHVHRVSLGVLVGVVDGYGATAKPNRAADRQRGVATCLV